MFVGMAILKIADEAVFKAENGHYFALHVIANAAITILCLPDVYFMVTEPVKALSTKEPSFISPRLVFSMYTA